MDVLHFFSHEILDNANLRDLVGSSNLDIADLLIGQQFVGQSLADSSQHDPQIIDLYHIRIILKHFCRDHKYAPPR